MGKIVEAAGFAKGIGGVKLRISDSILTEWERRAAQHEHFMNSEIRLILQEFRILRDEIEYLKHHK